LPARHAFPTRRSSDLGAELRRLGRQDRKGAPDTFDAAGYVALLRRLRDPDEHTVYAPQFHREVEESYAAEIPVPPEVPLVITEGDRKSTRLNSSHVKI